MTRPYMPEPAPDRGFFFSSFERCYCDEPPPAPKPELVGHCPYCHRDVRLDQAKGMAGTRCECGRRAMEYSETHQDVRIEFWEPRDEAAESALAANGWALMMWVIVDGSAYGAMYYRPKDVQ
jgi:hypothetical protein